MQETINCLNEVYTYGIPNFEKHCKTTVKLNLLLN